MSDSQSPYTQSLALVIGIDHYQNSLMNPLSSAAEADALAISDALAALGFRIQTLIGHEATKHNIHTALENLIETGSEDRVLVYFSGHSSLVIDSGGAEQAFLSASDTDINDASTALPLADFITFWTRTSARHVAFIFDAPLSTSALGITYTINHASPNHMIGWRACQVVSAGESGRTISGVVLGGLRAKHGHLGELDLYTFSDLAVYTQQRIQHEWAGKYQVVFGHLPGSQGGEMILHTTPDGIQRGISSSVASVNYASSGEATLVSRRTAVWNREEIQKMQDEAMARQVEKQQAQRDADSAAQPASSLPAWVIPVGAVVLIVIIVVVGWSVLR